MAKTRQQLPFLPYPRNDVTQVINQHRFSVAGSTAIKQSDLLIAWENGDTTDKTASIAMLGTPLPGVSETVGTAFDTVWPEDRVRNGSEIPNPTSWSTYSVAFVCRFTGRDGRTLFSTVGGDSISSAFSASSPVSNFPAYEGSVGASPFATEDPPNATDYQSVVFSKTGAGSAELFINGVSVGTGSGGASSTAWNVFMDSGTVRWASLWVANKTWTAVEAAEHYNSGNFLTYADLSV